MCRSRGSRLRTSRSSISAPAQSVTLPGVTSTASTSPSVSTSRCRLRPLIFFPPVVALQARVAVAHLHRLAVEDGGAGLTRPPLGQADLLAEALVQPFPGAVQAPAADAGVHGAPRREVVGQQPPGAAGPQEVEVGIADLADVDGTGPAAGLGGRHERLQPFPLGVGKIGRVGCAVHGRRPYPTPPQLTRPLCTHALNKTRGPHPAFLRSSWSWFSLLYSVFRLIPSSAAAAGLLPWCFSSTFSKCSISTSRSVRGA